MHAVRVDLQALHSGRNGRTLIGYSTLRSQASDVIQDCGTIARATSG